MKRVSLCGWIEKCGEKTKLELKSWFAKAMHAKGRHMDGDGGFIVSRFQVLWRFFDFAQSYIPAFGMQNVDSSNLLSVLCIRIF